MSTANKIPSNNVITLASYAFSLTSTVDTFFLAVKTIPPALDFDFLMIQLHNNVRYVIHMYEGLECNLTSLGRS